jgi:hypothetical protein
MRARGVLAAMAAAAVFAGTAPPECVELAAAATSSR